MKMRKTILRGKRSNLNFLPYSYSKLDKGRKFKFDLLPLNIVSHYNLILYFYFWFLHRKY